MSEGRTAWRLCCGPLRIEMNPLPVAHQHRKVIDQCREDFAPFASADFTSDAPPKLSTPSMMHVSMNTFRSISLF